DGGGTRRATRGARPVRKPGSGFHPGRDPGPGPPPPRWRTKPGNRGQFVAVLLFVIVASLLPVLWLHYLSSPAPLPAHPNPGETYGLRLGRKNWVNFAWVPPGEFPRGPPTRGQPGS